MKKIIVLVSFVFIVLFTSGCINNDVYITFDANGGVLSSSEVITVKKGTQIPVQINPTKEGYTFEGWYLGDEKWSFATNVATIALTLTAHWKINTYTISFNTNGGSEIEPITEEYGKALSKPENPTKVGFTFVGWDNEFPKTMPGKDLQLNAIWAEDTFTITFDTDGGTIIDPITGKYDEKIVKPSNPEKEGYTFAGWNPSLPDYIPAYDMTVTAIWSNGKLDVPVEESGLTNMLGSGKLYVTTFGQADKDYIREIVDEAIKGSQITYTFGNQLKASDVKTGDMVIAVVGYTSKGIAAEITQAGEVARAKAFAEKEGITLVICQLSGKARRGESTDPIIAECAPKADVVLIYDSCNGKGADYDGKYSKVYCKDNPNLFLFSDEWQINEYIAILVGNEE